MKRTLRDFLEGELLFEHLRTIYRYYLDTGGYERAEMVDELVEHLESDGARSRLAEGLTPEETELLYVLRLVGGIAPRDWLFEELASRSGPDSANWARIFRGLLRSHLVFLSPSILGWLIVVLSLVPAARPLASAKNDSDTSRLNTKGLPLGSVARR